VTLTIDGIQHDAGVGERLIDVINRVGVPVPHVCYHKQLGPIQTCDTCMVEVDGRLVRACAATVADGMTVATATPKAKAAQVEAFDVILSNHVLYCTVCDNNNGNCTVHNTVKMMAIEHQSIPYKKKPYELDMSHPFYRYDPQQCILCGRCVEACQNVEVNETLSINWSDPHPRVLWDGGRPMGESSCVSCGHCVSVCPCNALMEKTMLGEAGYFTDWPQSALDSMIETVKGIEPEIGYGAILQLSEVESDMRTHRTRKTKTVCTYCGVGCSYDVWTRDRHILKIEPEQGPANGISTCIKGKFGWGHINSPDRLTSPLIREGDTFRKATWDEALGLIARRFNEIKARDGADALAFISSSKCTNEENYLTQKLARAVVGTNNIDNCSRYCQAPATTGLRRTVGYGGDSGSMSDMAHADLIIILGSNTAEAHPVYATRVKQAQKLHGCKIICADIRENEMARRADVLIHPTPNTDLVWISAVSKYIFECGRSHTDFIKKWVNNFDEFWKSIEPFTLEFAAKTCNLTLDEMQKVAHMVCDAKNVCILWAMGVTQHVHGADTSTAISNLLLATGNYMRPGTGAYPLRGHNNVQGAGDVGAAPDQFPGYQSVNDPEIHAAFEKAWNVKLPTSKGLDNHEMVDAIHEGKLKSLFIMGEEMSIVDSNANYVGAAFEKLEFFVVQEIFFSDTCRYADVVLPGAPSLEKEGTFTSTERRIQRLYEVFPPLLGCRPDWQILQDIANALGANWNYQHPSDVMDEIASVAPIMAGVNYARLDGYKSLQWPVAPDGTDQPLLYTEQFPFPDGKARFFPVAWSGAVEAPTPEYDLHLNNGRLLEHFHEGQLTYRTPGIKEQVPDTFIEVSPELAESRGIQSGTWVKLRSKYGEVRLRALVTDRVRGHELYFPMNSTDIAVNRLTSSKADPITHTPAYKDASCNLTVLAEPVGESPLPAQNSRFGRPTPQMGVEVERKWKQPWYHEPGTSANTLVQLQRRNGNGSGNHGNGDHGHG
jgi:formate dehydrogenase major subunit